MRFITPLYWGKTPKFAGVLEFLIDPLFICEKVTADVRSGQTGYAWIIDQNLIMLAHYEKDFVGHEAMEIRIARNPQIVFRGLNELHDQPPGGPGRGHGIRLRLAPPEAGADAEVSGLYPHQV